MRGYFHLVGNITTPYKDKYMYLRLLTYPTLRIDITLANFVISYLSFKSESEEPKLTSPITKDKLKDKLETLDCVII
jgi:hypothetical protein